LVTPLSPLTLNDDEVVVTAPAVDLKKAFEADLLQF
jgi:hypothetical protein